MTGGADPKERRLTKASDFAVVYRQGRSWSNRLLALRGMENGRETTRYGFSVSKRVGKAVVRNRVRRRLREVSRLLPVRGGWDLVVIARAPSAEAGFAELQQAVRELAQRASVMSPGGQIR